MNRMSPQLRRAAVLGALLLAASLPAASLAAVGTHTEAGGGGQLLLQVRGSG